MRLAMLKALFFCLFFVASIWCDILYESAYSLLPSIQGIKSRARIEAVGEGQHPFIEVVANAPLEYNSRLEEICECVNDNVEISLERRRFIRERLNPDQKVILLMSSTLERIPLLHYSLMNIDMELVDAVYISVPFDNGSNRATKISSLFFSYFPKCSILTTPKHTALLSMITPLMKGLIKSDDILLLLNDDQAYRLNVVDTLLYSFLLNSMEKTAFAVSGFNFKKYIATEAYDFEPMWPKRLSHASPVGVPLIPVQLMERFAGIAFRFGELALGELIGHARIAGPDCDDLLLSWYLTTKGFNLVSFPSTFNNNKFAFKHSHKRLPLSEEDNERSFEEKINLYFQCIKRLTISMK